MLATLNAARDSFLVVSELTDRTVWLQLADLERIYPVLRRYERPSQIAALAARDAAEARKDRC